MESSQKTRQEKKISATPTDEKMKSISETDNCISMTFDSASDCGYKSGELSISSTHISSRSISDSRLKTSKSDQHLSYDSGVVTDFSSPLSSENISFDPDSSKTVAQETLGKTNKISWQDIFSQDKDGDTILHLAIVEARSDIIFPLIRLAPHPDFLDICNDLYQTPLHLATLTGKSNIVRRLVVAGATLDIQDHGGNIPLHIASRSGDLDCVQAILEPITKSELEEAKCSYQTYVEDYDLSHLINMKNFDGLSCVHLAAAGGFQKVMECLFDHHADIDDQEGKCGRTALHYAVENGNIDLIRLLLSKCHANPLVWNYAGQTSYCIARVLRKRNPSKTQRAVLDILKMHANRWESTSEFESKSSSDDEG